MQSNTRELKQIFDAISKSALVAITDKTGKILFANDAFCEVSGYSAHELLGKDHRIVNSGLHSKEFFQNLWETISSGHRWTGEIRNKSKSGDFYWVHTVITPLLSADGTIDRYLSIRFEITERKRIEEELRQTRELAVSSNQRLDRGEDIGKFGSWEYDFQKNIFWGSRGFYKLLYFPETMALLYQDFITSVFEEDRKVLEEAIEEALKTHQKFSCLCRVQMASKIFRWLKIEGESTLKPSGQYHLAGFAQDISEKVESEQALVEATMQAESASKTKARFLANMSHEIRTPMNGIIGMTNLLLGSSHDEEQNEKFRIIQNCGNSLLHIINDILDFSKLEADKLELESEPFNIFNCINETLSLLNPKAVEKEIHLSYQPSKEIPLWIRGDITRFKQILVNLVGNAIKFTKNGHVTIFSSAAPISNGLHDFSFKVQDNGIGIPDDLKNRLFQPFSQVDASTTRQFGGTGLGLAICKGLCEKMGGAISVESSVGKGSTFLFSFRARVIENPNKDNEESSTNPFLKFHRNSEDKVAVRILVADDNVTNQLVTVGFLNKLGYQSDVANNGLEVLKRLETHKYDLIFMDCHMPQMDGFEATKEIISRFTTAHRPKIVALTASTTKEDIDLCSACGMDGFLSKPLTIKELCKVLAAFGAQISSP